MSISLKSAQKTLGMFALAGLSLLNASCDKPGVEPGGPMTPPIGSKGGFKIYADPATGGTVFGDPGLPAHGPIAETKAKVTGITLVTKSKTFKADLNGSGEDRFIVVPQEGQEPKFNLESNLTGRTSLSGIEGLAFIEAKNGITDTIFVRITSDTRLQMFAVEKDSYVAMAPAIVQKQQGKIVPNSGGVVAKMR
jgi:hypothetical protein